MIIKFETYSENDELRQTWFYSVDSTSDIEVRLEGYGEYKRVHCHSCEHELFYPLKRYERWPHMNGDIPLSEVPLLEDLERKIWEEISGKIRIIRQ